MRYLIVLLNLFAWAGFLHAAAPKIVVQSGSYQVRAGDSFAAYVKAHGEALSYQWYHDGTPLSSQTSEWLILSAVTSSDAGQFHLEISNTDGVVQSEPATLTIEPSIHPDITPGTNGTVLVPNTMAYYDLYLPSGYGTPGQVFPILFTYNWNNGGMVDHFRTVAEEKQWIVVGSSQSRNNIGTPSKAFLMRQVVDHAVENLKVDPNRIFTSGMSGGGWTSFTSAKLNAPIVAGVFSMGGWLGDQYNTLRDIYIPGLLVARGNGDSDAGANSRLSSDRNHLERWLAPSDIRDWSFPGGHVTSPPNIQREVFDWFIANTTASTPVQRTAANQQQAIWKARITAGAGMTVYEEMVLSAFNQPRNAEALAARHTIDFLFSKYDLFLRKEPPTFATFTRKDFLRAYMYYSLLAYMKEPNPSKQLSATAALIPTGPMKSGLFTYSHGNNILRHKPHSGLDAYILENGLHARQEQPYVGDWDSDGVNNFTEFALGSDPLSPDSKPSLEMEQRGDDMYLSLPSIRPGALVMFEPMVSNDLLENSWSSISDNQVWQTPKPLSGGELTFRYTGVSASNMKFFTLKPSLLSSYSYWQDANNDGIPYGYQWHSLYGFNNDSQAGANEDDARFDTTMAGGAPLYYKFLSAADIGPDGGHFGDIAYRYHPILAGYKGYLYHEVWMGVPGTNVSDGIGVIHERAPSGVMLMTSSQATWYSQDSIDLLGSNYFERTRGYVVPSETGNYTFAIAGDDACELWLSTDEHPGRATKIAQVSGWSDHFQYDKNSEQQSVVLNLVAGKSYYIEILHKEGGGEGHCAVAWKTPSKNFFSVITAEHLRCLPAAHIEPETQWRREVWKNMPGDNISTLKSTIAAGTVPDTDRPLPISEPASNTGDSYGARIRGLLVAPETAAYTFWIASDDSSEIYLSSDATAANKTLIASVSGWVNPRAYDTHVSQKSTTLSLIAGQEYYIEILHKEGSGGDHLSVVWQRPGQARETITPEHMKAPPTTP